MKILGFEAMEIFFAIRERLRLSVGSQQRRVTLMLAFMVSPCGSTIAATTVSPCISPDGKKIIFSSKATGNGDLYELNLKEKKAVRLTTSGEFEGWPTYSPNGSQIVYCQGSDQISPVHLFISDSQLKSKRQVTEGNYFDSSPSLSSDGRKILFCRASRLRDYSLGGKTWDDWDIYSVNVDGGNLTRLTTAKYRQLNSPHFLGENRAVYAGELNTMGSNNQLYFLDFGKTNEVTPVEVTTGGAYITSDPNVSPKTKKIVFISNRVTRVGIYDYDLWLSTSEGKGIHKVTNLQSLIQNPFFSTDGNQIFFLSDPDRENKYDLMRCDINGLDLVKVYSGIR